MCVMSTMMQCLCRVFASVRILLYDIACVVYHVHTGLHLEIHTRAVGRNHPKNFKRGANLLFFCTASLKGQD